MDRRSEFKFEVNVVANDAAHVSLTLSVTNSSPNNYYISGNCILTDGFIMKSFDIYGPSFILCSRIMRHHDITPEKILFNSTSTLSNTLTLSDFCHFEHALPGIYEIRFFNGFPLYDLEKIKVVILLCYQDMIYL